MALDKLTIINNGGLSTTSDYRVGVLTATKFVGPIEGGSATFAGNVSIGGTLTYEDVTNIDSVGIITAKQGIHIDDSIVHIGDTDTKIRFPGSDIFTIETGGSERVRVDSAGLKILDKLLHFGDIDTAIRFPAADTITAETGGSERLRITSAGKIGIGDINPQTTLHIKQATDNNTDGIRLSRVNSNASYSQYIDTSARLNIGYANPSTADPDPQITLDQNGNVGINTNSPSKLVTIKADAPFLRLEAADTSDKRLDLQVSTSGIATISAEQSSQQLSFRTTGGEALRIASDGDIGINQTNPYYKLHLNFTDNTTSFYGGTGGNWGGNGIRIENDSTLAGAMALIHFRVHSADWHIGNRYVSSSPDKSDFVFFHEATEKLRITEDGKVGIGTDDPDSLLHVAGSGIPTIKLEDTDAAGGYAHFEVNGEALFIESYDEDGTQGQILFKNASDEVMRIRSGKVGIGTDNPSNPLHITGADPQIKIQDTANGNNAKISLDGPNSNLNFDWDSGSDRKINFINSGGGDISVGIGEDSPAGKLHISSGTSGDCELIIEADTDNNAEGDNPRIVFKQDGGSSTGSVGLENNELYLAQSASGGGRGIIFKTGTTTGYTNATEKMRLDEQGRLLIGNSSTNAQEIGDGILQIFTSDRKHPAIKVNAGNSNGFTMLADTYKADESQVNIGLSYSASKFVLSTSVKVSDTADNVYLSSQDTFAAKPCALTMDHQGVLTFLNTNTSATTTTDSAVSLTERFRINSAGQVGIGTDIFYDSTTKLEVKGRINTVGSASTGSLNYGNGTVVNVGSLSPHNLQLITGNSTRMTFENGTGEAFRIRSNGEVLINRTSSINVASTAASKLQVHHGAGNISAAFYSNADAIGPGGVLALGHSRSTDTGVLQDDDVLGQIRFAGADGTDMSTQGALISAEVNGTPSSDNMPTDLIFYTNNGSASVGERMRINKAGFVKIGGGSPVSKLTVDGDIYFSNGALISNFDSNGTGGSNIDHIWHSDASNYGRGGTWNFVSDGAFKGAGQSTIQIGYLANAGGGHFLNNVGIGITTVARGPLHVHNNSGDDCQIHLTNNDTGSTSGDGLTIFTDTDTSGIWSRENVDFQIATNSVERMRIHNDGRVDIGGTNEVQITGSSQAILYLHGAIVGANLDFAYGQRIMLDDDDTGTTSADRERGSIYCQFNGNATGGDTSNETRIWNIYSDVNCNQDYDNVYGVYADVRTTHTSGTVSNMRGMYGICQATNTGQITEMIGVYGLSQLTTGSTSVTINDLVGVKGRANMCAGSSTANAVDVVGVWANIDNDNNTAQATGGKCALFFGSYDKTTGLHNPQGIRIDTDVPNYMRGGLALGNGGNFLPDDDHMLHIQDQANARGILLRQTGNQYNVIKGQANRTAANNAIVDLQGWWDTTQVARIRIDSGTDTSNKDDGKIEFATAAAGSITDRMIIQANGEIAMKSDGTPGDAIANLHVQNGTFRVSQSSGPTTEYLQVTAHTHNTDGDRHAMRYVSGGTNYMSLSKNGQLGTLHHHYAGRTRSDANAPTNYYAHGSFGFHAYAGRTDDTSNYRTLAFMRAWEGGDTEDRNFMYYVDSTSDTTSVDYDQHQRFGIKASGMLQSREDGWFGRCESDEASPNSVYTASNTNLVRTWANNGEAQTYMQAVAAPATNIYSFYVETGTSSADDDIQFRIRSSDGRISSDSGAIGTPGDYAECFEWLDGNPSNEDRVGISVVLVGDKIRPANSSDDPSKIIGIVSANPVVVGDAAPLKYHDRYLKDDWGRYIMEDVEMLVWNTGENEYQPTQTDTFALQNCVECIEVSDIDAALAEGRIKQWVVDQNLRRMDKRRKVNPNFDVTKKDIYKPRLERPEWDAIGMVGKVYMRKGQPTGTNWIKLSDKTASIERWLVR